MADQAVTSNPVEDQQTVTSDDNTVKRDETKEEEERTTSVAVPDSRDADGEAMTDHDTTSAVRKRDLVKSDIGIEVAAPSKRLKLITTGSSSNNAAPTGKHLPVLVPPSDPAELEKVLKGQVEFYFSDENMKYDKFFQDKIRATEGNWLNVEYILSCRNVKRLQVESREAIVRCLADSSLETKLDATGYWVRRSEPLPTLEERPNKRIFQGRKDQKGINMTTLHNAGCICEAVACPEESSWENVKAALASAVPENARVRFVSRMQGNGSCFIYVFPFDGDKEFFSDEKVKIDVCGAPVTVKLVDSPEVADKVLKTILPGQVQSQRAKMLSRQQQNSGQAKRNLDKNEQRTSKKLNNNRPIVIAGTEFKSIQHLRQCVRECLNKNPIGTVLAQDKNGFKVINALLDYHPRGADKKKDMTGIKVGESQMHKQSTGTPSRCFFIIKKTAEEGVAEEGVAEEDFSVLKCLAALEDNPPFADPSTPTPTAADTDAVASPPTTTSTNADSNVVDSNISGTDASIAVKGEESFTSVSTAAVAPE